MAAIGEANRIAIMADLITFFGSLGVSLTGINLVFHLYGHNLVSVPHNFHVEGKILHPLGTFRTFTLIRHENNWNPLKVI